MSKLKAFFLYDKATKLILFEAFLFLGRARFLKSIPFSKMADSLGLHIGETSAFEYEDKIKIIKNISQAINITSRYTFWESKCLVKAIAAMKMLERRKIDCTLYLGTSKDENGKLIAHAWLRSGSYYVTGFEGKEKFTVVGTFAKTASNNIQGAVYGKER